jgi:hypothetical protein
MRAHALLAILVLAPLTDAVTQEWPVRLGNRVRVTAPSLGVNRYVARFEYVRGDTLVVWADSNVKYPLAAVTQLEVSRGRSNTPVILGASLGAIGGAFAGLVLGPEKECQPLDILCHPDEPKLAAALVGLLGGGLAGGFLGAAMRTDRWEDVPLDPLRVSVVPQRGGFGIGASIAF